MPRRHPPPTFATEEHPPPDTPTIRLWQAVVAQLAREASGPCRCPLFCLRRQALVDAGRRDLRELVAPLGLDRLLRVAAQLPPCRPETVTDRPARQPTRSAA